jgi:CubicO group peptidase (beta-lactamase class C family)
MKDAAWLTEVVATSQAKHKVPALGAAVVVNDDIRVAVAGVRKAGNATAATAQDKFHLGSCTKSMTATLVALLVEEGKTEVEHHNSAGFSGTFGDHAARLS